MKIPRRVHLLLLRAVCQARVEITERRRLVIIARHFHRRRKKP